MVYTFHGAGAPAQPALGLLQRSQVPGTRHYPQRTVIHTRAFCGAQALVLLASTPYSVHPATNIPRSVHKSPSFKHPLQGSQVTQLQTPTAVFTSHPATPPLQCSQVTQLARHPSAVFTIHPASPAPPAVFTSQPASLAPLCTVHKSPS